MKRGVRTIAALTAAMQFCFFVMPTAALAEEGVSQEHAASVRREETETQEAIPAAESGESGRKKQSREEVPEKSGESTEERGAAAEEKSEENGADQAGKTAKPEESGRTVETAETEEAAKEGETVKPDENGTADEAGKKPEPAEGSEAEEDIATDSVLTDSGALESMDISATLPQGASDFTVTIPSEIYAGTLRTDQDTELRYSIEAEMADGETGYLKISAEKEGWLYHDEDRAFRIPFENQFGVKKLRKTGLDSRVVVDSSLRIRGGDVQKAKSGDYTGTVLFEIEYISEKEKDNPGKNENGGNKKPPTPEKKPEKQEQKGEKLEETGKYYASLSLRRNDDFEEKSMCDPLFFEKADLDVGTENTKLTLYIIDPVPNYPEYGTPLKNVRFLYQGKSYNAKVGSGKKIIKHFAQAEGFIDAEGDYETSAVTVTVPNAAVRDSVNGELQCEAYVNTVMKSIQKFRVVLDNIEKGRSETKKNSSIVLENKAYLSDLILAEGKNKKKKSKLDALFSHKADILPDGETAALTLYFIDPVPAFPEEGTAFSSASFLYDGKEYEASVDTSDPALIRKYQKTEGKITETGDYKSGKMQAELPVAAVNDSKSGKLRLRMQVKAGYEKEMTVTVFLENLKSGSTKNSAMTAGGKKTEEAGGGNAAIPAGQTAGSTAPAVRSMNAGKLALKTAGKASGSPAIVPPAAGGTATAGMGEMLRYSAPAKEEQNTEGLHLPGMKKERSLLMKIISFSLLCISSGVGYGLKRKFL